MNEKRLKEFWNKEYKDPGLFGLSDEPSRELTKFCRWLTNEFGKDYFHQNINVLDAGCGNGRNLLWLNENFNVSGFGYDISQTAIEQAKIKKEKIKSGEKINFAVMSIGDKIPLEDESVDIVLDVMASHFLKEKEREIFLNEITRVLKPEGILFFKSFYARGDKHAKELIKKEGAGEHNAYIHPKMKVYEYVWTDQAIEETFSKNYIIKEKFASHQHNIRGKPNKRRSITCYFEKK